MKIENNLTGKPEQSFGLSFRLRSAINIIVLVHLLFFVLCAIAGRTGELPAIFSLAAPGIQSHWWTGLITYQFIHSSTGEFLLSTSMLWLFGHLLQRTLGSWKVLLFYFLSVTLSGIVFILSHLVFPVFSGSGEMLDGSFGGALVLMALAAFLHGSSRLRLGHKLQLSVWHLSAVFLLLSFVLVYRHNMACVLIYASGICAGFMLMPRASSEETTNLPAADIS